MYERLFEEHIKGTVSEEWFMQLSVKYETEKVELKSKIKQQREEISKLEDFKSGKEQFQNAVRSFMETERLTPPACGFGRSAEFRTLGLVVPNHARYQHTVRNIVALLAWSASHCSVFLPAQSLPASAAGGGNA